MLAHLLRVVPFRSRPAFQFHLVYNVGRGVFGALLPLSLVILKGNLNAPLWHLSVMGSIWGGAGLLSPLFAYLCRRLDPRLLVVWPNVATGLCMIVVPLLNSAASFLIVLVAAFLLGFPTRVVEMSVYRLVFPPSHLARAVGWMKSMSFVVAALTGCLGTYLIDVSNGFPWYSPLFVLCGVLLFFGARDYGRIPLPASEAFRKESSLPIHAIFFESLVRLSADKRFLIFQVAFMASGFANHLSMFLIVEVMNEDLQTTVWITGTVFVLIPQFLKALMAPLWGLVLDRITPMAGRAIFSGFMMAAYGMFCYGGLPGQIAPFFLGSFLQGISQSGNQINWETGSLYFARRDQVPLYNSVHVTLTGLRGLIAPFVGLLLFENLGWGSWVFGSSVVLSAVGMIFMIYLVQTDSGPREDSLPSPAVPSVKTK